MELLVDSQWKLILTSVLLVSATYVGVVVYFRRCFEYWKKRGVPSLAPRIPFGTDMGAIDAAEFVGLQIKVKYGELKALGLKHGGLYFFTSPKYLPVDPQYIKHIMQQDFQHFTHRGLYHNERDDPISTSMVTLGGDRWKNLRNKLSPAFTPGKIRRTFDIVIECGNQMRRALENKQVVDIREITECYTTDVIGSTAFGLQCNSYVNPDSEFRKYAKRALGFSLVRFIKVAFSFVCPNLMLRMKIKTFDQEASEFFQNVVTQTVRLRRGDNIVRHDLLHLLIELQNECGDAREAQNCITLKEVTANVFSFFVAGYETASAAMTFALYELSVNPDVQAKARDEVNQVLEQHGGKITYDAMADLKYINQVIDETLRKYPPFSIITRECSQEYLIPGTDTVVEKGTLVIIPVLGLHHDPEYYPEPDKFDPERFSEENKKHIQPFTYLPFGEGPRICIGARLAVLEMKVGLAILLRNFKFSLNKKTALPIKMEPFNLIMTPKAGIFMDIEKLVTPGYHSVS